MKRLSILIFLTLHICVSAQNKMVKGNGKITSETRSLQAFNALYVDMYCDVYVSAGSMPMAEISADKNIMNKLSLTVIDNELRIAVKDGYWLQSTRPRIYIQVPYINKITTRGQQTNIGNIRIDGIDVDQFETDILYGTIELEGIANKLFLRSSNRNYYDKKGTLDASRLLAKHVDAKIQGSNSAILHAVETLIADLMHDARITLYNEPSVVKLKGRAVMAEKGLIRVNGDTKQESIQEHESSVANLQYIELKVKNNSISRKHFVIRGPNKNGRTFSYGFPMMPMATRVKNVPVGSEIFQQKGVLPLKKLITITDADEGKIVNLFSK